MSRTTPADPTEMACPVCAGAVEYTPSGALLCREHGSTHLRIENAWGRPAAEVLAEAAGR